METEQYQCPGCKGPINSGAAMTLGPDPVTPEYGPLYWHPWCLKWHNTQEVWKPILLE